MFETLKPQPADKILALVQKFKEDPRPQKIDLGVGVYKNAEGVTPVMRAVKAAEHQLWQDETTKSYVGLTGDPAFSDGMIQMVLGNAVPRGAAVAVATPGGPSPLYTSYASDASLCEDPCGRPRHQKTTPNTFETDTNTQQ